MYHARVYDILPVVEFNEEVSPYDCLAAKMLILWTLKVSHETMQNCLQRMGSDKAQARSSNEPLIVR